jgi:3-oxoacyl-[acyl-carrier-protein] synthase II
LPRIINRYIELGVIKLPIRVVVTGIGMVTPLGNDTDTTWNALISGQSGAGKVSLFDSSPFPTNIACEVKNFDPSLFMDRKEIRQTDRYIQFAMAAAHQALENSGLKIDNNNCEDIATIIGSGYGGLSTIEKQVGILNSKGHNRVSPFLMPMMVAEMGAAKVSIALGAKGAAYSVTSSCCSGSDSIGAAADMIMRGDAKAVITGGAESTITSIGFAGFSQAGALSTKRNDNPETASRPFDLDRDGFVMGEGACVLVLEELENAKRRGANILAELAGYASTADAYHITHPAEHGEGAVRSMKKALKKANIDPTELGYINAHGTSTPINDREETSAIKSVFGDYARKIPISSTKSMHGHLLGAGGALEAAICALVVKNKIIPPTINLENQDPDCDLDYTPGKAKEFTGSTALSNTFGFGGHNTAIIFKEFNL